MDNLKSPNQPLYRKVLYFQWALIGLAIALEYLAWRFATSDPQAAHIGLSLLLLLAMVVQSLLVPVACPYWQRVSYLLVEIALIAASSMCGVARFISPLFIVSVAKASLLLDCRGLIVLGLSAFAAQIVCAGYKIWLTTPGLHSASLSGWLVSSIVGSALIVTFTYGSLMVLVALLTRSLLSEQKSRLEAQRLAKEVETLAGQLERTRIAREIHDSLGHTLTALKIQIEVARRFADCDQERFQKAFELAQDLAAQSLTDVRLAVESIRLSDFDFKQAVAALAEEAQSRLALTVKLDLADSYELPVPESYQIYRIIQECITNTLKHAGATEMSVGVVARPHCIELTVRDNGCGLEQGAIAFDGFGLRGIRERVASMHGTVEFENLTPRGTCLKANFPLPP